MHIYNMYKLLSLECESVIMEIWFNLTDFNLDVSQAGVVHASLSAFLPPHSTIFNSPSPYLNGSPHPRFPFPFSPLRPFPLSPYPLPLSPPLSYLFTFPSFSFFCSLSLFSSYHFLLTVFFSLLPAAPQSFYFSPFPSPFWSTFLWFPLSPAPHLSWY